MSENSRDDAQRSYHYDEVREQLRYWPYTIHQIADTLDVSLIEGRGRQILFQALNSGDLTGFLGSGVAASYGRLSWTDWEREQISVVEHNYKAFKRVSEASLALLRRLIEAVEPEKKSPKGKPENLVHQSLRAQIYDEKNPSKGASLKQMHRHNAWRWLNFRCRQIENARQQVIHLGDTFDRATKGEGEFPGGEGLPVKFEIAQQLHDELRRHVAIFMPEEKPREESLIDGASCWPGSRIDGKSAAPKKALDLLRDAIEHYEQQSGDAYNICAVVSKPGDKEEDGFRESLRDYSQALQEYYRAYNRPEARFSFESLTKLLLADECAHALITLRQGVLAGREISELSRGEEEDLWKFERKFGIFDLGSLKRDISGIRDAPDRYRVLSAFRLAHFSGNAGKASPLFSPGLGAKAARRWDRVLTFLQHEIGDDLVQTQDVGDERRFLTPTSRFLVPMMLCLHRRPAALLGFGNRKSSVTLFDPAVKKTDFTSRRSIIASSLDPMPKIVDNLGVRRFITTNYDFEIERYFIDAGYRVFPPTDTAPRQGQHRHDDFRADGTGGTLRDQSFVRERAAELVGFTIGNDRDDAAVFHLHGRATRDEPLVITERNYMNLYLWEDEYRDTVNEGITMAFSSAPLIFLGLGMREADLLRPLRQFMSNRDRTIGYNAVALLPADQPMDNRTKFATALFLRYGVHTIFYGSGEIDYDLRGEEKRSCSIDWLAQITSLIGSLDDVLIQLGEGKAIGKPGEDLLDVLLVRSGTLGKDLDELAGCLALPALFGFRVEAKEKGKDDCARFKQKVREDHLLRTCRFTPVRRTKANQTSPHYDKDVLVDGTPYLRFEVTLLSKLIRVAMDLKDASPTGEPSVWQKREIAAIRLALAGLRSSILTGCLNAALVGIELEWRSWWKRWRHSPPRRLARLGEAKAKEGDQAPDDMPRMLVRHHIDNVITRIDRSVPKSEFIVPNAKGQNRVSRDWYTGVRAFDTFVAAVAHIQHDTPPRPDERLLFTIAAHRGLGKGTLQSAFATPRGVMAYAHAAWGCNYGKKVRLHSAAFINLSFATEVASCFDMIMQALIDAVADLRSKIEGKEADRIESELKDELAGVSRSEMLRSLAHMFGEAGNAAVRNNKGMPRPRFLLLISSLDLLFNRNPRAPKNREISSFIDLLLGSELAQLPFDIVLLAAENGIGAPFSLPVEDRSFLTKEINRPDLPLRAKEQIAQRIRNGNINIDIADRTRTGSTQQAIDQSVKDLPNKPLNHVHFARPVNPVYLLIDNFPVLAIALYLLHPPPGRPVEDLRAAFNELVESSRRDSESEKAASALWQQDKPPDGEEIDGVQRVVAKNLETMLGDRIVEHAKDCMSGVTDLKSALRERIRQSEDGTRVEWRDVRRRLYYNRFSVTLLLAAAEHIVLHAADPIEGGREAERFVLNTTNMIGNIGDDRREELVLEAVIGRYQLYHRIAVAEADIELHKLLLRHLGVIGAPLGSAVIVRLPQIRDYFERIGVPLETSRRRFIARALTTLAYRGLVFRVKPHPRIVQLAEDAKSEGKHPEDRHWPADREYRYALHRVVQSFAVSKLGVGLIDPISANLFAPTLYSSMPSSSTKLSRAAFGFIRELLIGLSQYPDLAHEDTNLRSWLFTTKEHSVKVQALRAALSLARSTLSVSTISRFSGFQPTGSGFPRRGYMETYKVRLRWIIRLAWELAKDGSTLEEPLRAADPLRFNEPYPKLTALYRDEIVWLYNEIGVIALAQGNLTEALGFLRQAAEYNEGIEGRPRLGPIFDHIDLNHAIVQLERGRISSAETRLERIKRNSRFGVVQLSARGYLCLIRHITGRFEGLAEEFKQVTSEIQEINDQRASAILLAHRGRFVAATDPKSAQRHLKDAQSLAETGGHEDIRHHIEIARIAVSQRFSHNETAINVEHGLSRLKEIENYGRRMDIWSIQADALRLRAELLLAHGETESAGEELIRSLAICRRNRMLLRLNSALTLYADVLLIRGDISGAKSLASRSLELAKSIRYNLETSRAQRLLSRIDPAVS